MLKLAARYLEVQATLNRARRRRSWSSARRGWCTTLHAFVLQLRGAVERLTHGGRLRPFGLALAQRKVTVGDMRYEGFRRPAARAIRSPTSSR